MCFHGASSIEDLSIAASVSETACPWSVDSLWKNGVQWLCVVKVCVCECVSVCTGSHVNMSCGVNIDQSPRG